MWKNINIVNGIPTVNAQARDEKGRYAAALAAAFEATRKADEGHRLAEEKPSKYTRRPAALAHSDAIDRHKEAVKIGKKEKVSLESLEKHQTAIDDHNVRIKQMGGKPVYSSKPATYKGTNIRIVRGGESSPYKKGRGGDI